MNIEFLQRQSSTITNPSALRMFVFECMKVFDALNDNLRESLQSKQAFVFDICDDLSGTNLPGAQVNLVTDEKNSLELIKYGLTKYLLTSEQNPKRTYRLPGVINVSRACIDLVSSINMVKALIEDSMTNPKILHPRMRGDFFRKNIRMGVSLKELYRKINIVREPVESLSFTWANHVTTSDSVGFEELCDLLESEIAECGESERNGLAISIKQDLESVLSLGSAAEYKILRPIPPHPRVNLIVNKNGVTTKEQIHAHLPILIDGDVSSVGSYIVKGLKDSHTERRARRPSVNDDFKLLIPRMCLYYRS